MMLPSMHWPPIVLTISNWLHSLAFLDMGLLARPECFAELTPSGRKLLRFFVSHGAFWLAIAVFSMLRCWGARDFHRDPRCVCRPRVRAAAAARRLSRQQVLFLAVPGLDGKVSHPSITGVCPQYNYWRRCQWTPQPYC